MADFAQMGRVAEIAPVGPARSYGEVRAMKWARLVVLPLWAGSMLVLCAYLLARHEVALPGPVLSDPVFVAALAPAPGRPARWHAVHVLDDDCKCSQEVLEHLLARGASKAQMDEDIVLVGHDPPVAARAVARGYGFSEVSPQQLFQRYHVEAAPLLLVADPAGAPRYVGGYTDKKRDGRFHDAAILAALRAGDEVGQLPTFGCAVSDGLRDAVDPLRLSFPPRSKR